MAKSSKDRDRRAVVEQLRRDQKRAERRRTILVISLCAVVALVIIGAAAVPLIKANRNAAQPLADIGVSASEAGCQDVITKKATGTQDHKEVGTPIAYPDAPPADGPHYPTPASIERKFYTAKDRPEVQYLVHNLEHGYNLLWYDETVAKDKKQVADLKAIAAKYTGAKPSDKFIVAPWTSEDGKKFPSGTHVALTHWSVGGDANDTSKQKGVWQYCGKPSGEVVTKFVKDYPYTDSPEPLGA